MTALLKEISDIPERAQECYEKNKDVQLPTGVPYLGMGASYNAPLTLYYCGVNISPYIASEYFNYLSDDVQPKGVLISQSGETSETIWNLEKFEEVVAITNNPDSQLAKSRKAKDTIELFAKEEQFSSSKTYFNTLLVLYLGLGVDPAEAIEKVQSQFSDFENSTKQLAKDISSYLRASQSQGLYILGSGPNIGTAQQGALVLSESTKLSWIGMPLTQYDHGPKETAKDSVVLVLNAHGKNKKRIEEIQSVLNEKSNTLFLELKESELPERLSPLTLISQLNLLMGYLVEEMKVDPGFFVGGKVTTVPDSTMAP